MVQLRVRNNSGESATMLVEGTMTIREAMAKSGLEFGAGTMQLNSVIVNDLDRMINSFGTFEEAYLSSVAMKNNA